jgi:YbgC/YbaW family acyl-CoA thioester hydrolase
MAYEFKLKKLVEFAETDAAGILHFSNYFRFMELTEHAFFRSLGFSVHEGTRPKIGWPRVNVKCDYHKPLSFEDLVEIQLLVKQKKSKAIEYQFIFRKINHGSPPLEVARGTMTTVCIGFDENGMIKGAIPIPDDISNKIEAAPHELFE